MTAADNPPQKYISEVRKSQEGEPHDCPSCGRRATDPHPPRLLYLAPDRPGSYGSHTVDCPSCGTLARWNNPNRTEAEQLSQDVREMLDEDKGKGEKGGGSSSKAPPKPRPKLRVRWEQEPVSFSNGRSKDKVVIKSERYDETTRKCITLSHEMVAELRIRSAKERQLDGTPTPMATFIRQALAAHLKTLRNPQERRYGAGTENFYVRLYESEVTELKQAKQVWELSYGVLVENCLELLLGSEE